MRLGLFVGTLILPLLTLQRPLLIPPVSVRYNRSLTPIPALPHVVELPLRNQEDEIRLLPLPVQILLVLALRKLHIKRQVQQLLVF
jgi:hypothetical protein